MNLGVESQNGSAQHLFYHQENMSMLSGQTDLPPINPMGQTASIDKNWITNFSSISSKLGVKSLENIRNNQKTYVQPITIMMSWIHGKPVGWAGAVMQKPLAIQKCYQRTDGPTWQGIESRINITLPIFNLVPTLY